MKYYSTRDAAVRMDAAEAIKMGLSRDGGLLTPEVFPKLTPALLEDLRGQDLRPAGRGGDEAVFGGFLRGGADGLYPGRLLWGKV